MSQESRNVRRLGEAVVIVLSVLFAFGIEAWWGQRQQDEELVSLVELLREDLAKSIADMERRLVRDDESISGLEDLISVVHGDRPPPNPDSLAVLHRMVWSSRRLTPGLAALETAVSSPAWDLIPARVKVRLTEFKNSSDSFAEARDIQALAHLTELAANYGGIMALEGRAPPSSSLSADYDGLLSDPRFEPWLVTRVEIAAFYAFSRRSWIRRLSEIEQTLQALDPGAT